MKTIPFTPARIARFWSKVKKTEACWEWQGAKYNTEGYGVGMNWTDADGKHRRAPAHRIAFELTTGPIPEGKLIDHMCHNPSCVNPDHLRIVTQKQNMENLAGAHVDSTSGYRGVSWKKRERRWLVTVVHNRVPHYGGYFEDKEEAAEVARKLRQKLFTHSFN
jgi:hypothetical protein